MDIDTRLISPSSHMEVQIMKIIGSPNPVTVSARSFSVVSRSLFIRQILVKKRSKHARRLTKRFLILDGALLKSFRSAPRGTGKDPTCQWNMRGARILLREASSYKGIGESQRTLTIMWPDSAEEVELVFENTRSAERWTNWLRLAADFGGVDIGTGLVQDDDIRRCVKGANLPGFLRPLAYVFPESTWITEFPVGGNEQFSSISPATYCGTAKVPWLTFILDIDLTELEIRRLTALGPGVPVGALCVAVTVQDTEAEFVVDFNPSQSASGKSHNFRVESMSGGYCHLHRVTLCGTKEFRPETSTSTFSIFCAILLMTQVQHTDSIYIGVYLIPSQPIPSNDGGIYSIFSRGGTRSLPLAAQWEAFCSMEDPAIYMRRPDFLEPKVHRTGTECAIRNLCTTVPWWYVFDPLPPEPHPLPSEFNYSDWILEAKRIARVLRRIKLLFKSIEWLLAAEQPPTTIALVLYTTGVLVYFPQHLIVLLILVPMWLVLIGWCPLLRGWQSYWIHRSPLALLFIDINSLEPGAIGKGVPRFLRVAASPIEEDYFNSQGLLVPSVDTLRSPIRYPYWRTMWQTATSLFLWTVYGGWTAPEAEIPAPPVVQHDDFIASLAVWKQRRHLSATLADLPTVSSVAPSSVQPSETAISEPTPGQARPVAMHLGTVAHLPGLPLPVTLSPRVGSLSHLSPTLPRGSTPVAVSSQATASQPHLTVGQWEPPGDMPMGHKIGVDYVGIPALRRCSDRMICELYGRSAFCDPPPRTFFRFLWDRLTPWPGRRTTYSAVWREATFDIVPLQQQSWMAATSAVIKKRRLPAALTAVHRIGDKAAPTIAHMATKRLAAALDRGCDPSTSIDGDTKTGSSIRQMSTTPADPAALLSPPWLSNSASITGIKEKVEGKARAAVQKLKDSRFALKLRGQTKQEPRILETETLLLQAYEESLSEDSGEDSENRQSIKKLEGPSRQWAQQELEEFLAVRTKGKKSRAGGGGIRGAVRDLAAVSRVIIGYRRGLEKFVNLFSWTHRTTTLVWCILLTAIIIIGPFVYWPLLVLYQLASFIRKAYQKSDWERFARHALRHEYLLLRTARSQREDKRLLQILDQLSWIL